MIKTEIVKEEYVSKTYVDKEHYYTSDGSHFTDKDKAEIHEKALQNLKYVKYDDMIIFDKYTLVHQVYLTDDNINTYAMDIMHNRSKHEYIHLRGFVCFIIDDEMSDYPQYEWWTVAKFKFKIDEEKSRLDNITNMLKCLVE